MYKYLASRHLPKFVLFSEKLPYGIVIKRLPPKQAWEEYYCNKILAKFHPFDFKVKYHQSLDCISEKYLPGFDVMDLPKEFFEKENFVRLIFYWAGKCACVGYILGLGDRGHNERLQANEAQDLFQFINYTKRYEPILNIDFEEFPSKRLFSLNTDATEVALLFYAIILQLDKHNLKLDFKELFNVYYDGFLTKFSEVYYLWDKNRRFIIDNLKRLFRIIKQKDSQKIINIIAKRAIEFPDSKLFYQAYELIEADLKKSNLSLGKKYSDMLKQKRERLRYHQT